MTESTFILWGIKFATEEWEPLIGNFLIMTGIVFIVAYALVLKHLDEYIINLF